jgi:hypothetical protein
MVTDATVAWNDVHIKSDLAVPQPACSTTEIANGEPCAVKCLMVVSPPQSTMRLERTGPKMFAVGHWCPTGRIEGERHWEETMGSRHSAWAFFRLRQVAQA